MGEGVEMIEVVQGAPGSGKSATAVARAIKHLREGGVVATNFRLVDNWADEIAKRSLLSRISQDHREKTAVDLYRRFFVVDSVPAIRSIFPRKSAVKAWRSRPKKYLEGQGLLLLDEAQLIFNCRKWDKNAQWIEFFTQHRKLGWDVVLIAHSIEMIDSQIRPLAEFESRYRNMQKVKFPVLGFPLSPFPLFLSIRRYAGLGAGAGVIADRALYPLPLWAAELYDTTLEFTMDGWGKQTQAVPCGPPPIISADLPRQRVSIPHPGCTWSKWAESEKVIDLTEEVPPQDQEGFGLAALEWSKVPALGSP